MGYRPWYIFNPSVGTSVLRYLEEYGGYRREREGVRETEETERQ